MLSQIERRVRFGAGLLLTAASALGVAVAPQVASKVEASPQTPPGPGPIPIAGPLAEPKSIDQPGAPVEATRAAIPADNPQTPEKIALGKKLFFDGRLSVDGTVACSTCHDPARAFTDGRPVSIGVKDASASAMPRRFSMRFTTNRSSGMGGRKRSRSKRRFPLPIRVKWASRASRPR